MDTSRMYRASHSPKFTAIITVALLFVFIASATVSGDSSNYFYDDLGRLSRVVKGASGEIYKYDELGNLIAIVNATTSQSPPVINSITPDVLFVSHKMLVKIDGNNLLSTETVTSDNPALVIENVTATDSEITAEMTASSPAGSATITVTTLHGSTTIGVTFSDSTITMAPAQAALAPASTGTITVNVFPNISSAITLNIKNSSSSVVDVPQSIAVPSTGIANFNVTALQEGVADIAIGDALTVVFVTSPFFGNISGLSTKPVSLIVEAPPGTSPTISSPVSIYVDAPAGTSPSVSDPVSVLVEALPGTSPSVSYPVSVFIDAPAGTSPTVAHPVSVSVDVSAPVSTITDPSDGTTLIGASYIISGTAADGIGSGIQKVEVSTDLAHDIWDTATGIDNWSYTWSLPPDGPYNIKSRAVDNAGNIETPGAGISVVVDNTLPSATIVTPTDNQVMDCSYHTITGTAADNGNGVKRVEVSTDPGNSVWTPVTGTNNWTYSWPLPAAGSYTIKARAVDMADNVGLQTSGTDVTVSPILVFQSEETTASGGVGSGVVQLPNVGLLIMSPVHQYDEAGLNYDSGFNYDMPTVASGSWTTAEYDMSQIKLLSVGTEINMTANLNATLQIRYKSNITDSWSNWETLTPDPRTFRFFQIKSDIISADPSSKGQISKFEISVYDSCN